MHPTDSRVPWVYPTNIDLNRLNHPASPPQRFDNPRHLLRIPLDLVLSMYLTSLYGGNFPIPRRSKYPEVVIITVRIYLVYCTAVTSKWEIIIWSEIIAKLSRDKTKIRKAANFGDRYACMSRLQSVAVVIDGFDHLLARSSSTAGWGTRDQFVGQVSLFMARWRTALLSIAQATGDPNGCFHVHPFPPLLVESNSVHFSRSALNIE